MAVAVRRQRRQYHQERKDFKPGTKVWLFTPQSQKNISKKLTPYWTGPWRVCAEPAKYETMVRIAPDPSWKNGSNRGTHVVSIDRLKLYHGSSIQAPGNEVDIEMSDEEFAKALSLEPRKSSDSKDPPRAGDQGGKGKKEESEDDSDELGPSPPPGPRIIQPGQETLGPEAPQKRYPKTPKPTKKDGQPRTPSPPQTRAQSAKKRAAQLSHTQTPDTVRLDPGLNWQPRVELTPVTTERAHKQPVREPRVEITPIPPDMLNYYKNYRSPVLKRCMPTGLVGTHANGVCIFALPSPSQSMSEASSDRQNQILYSRSRVQ